MFGTGAPITAVLGTLFSEIFRTDLRCTGITLGYQVGAALAGGTDPFIAAALLQRFDGAYMPIAICMMCTGVVSVLAVAAARRWAAPTASE